MFLLLKELAELAQVPKTMNKHGSAPKSYCLSSAGEETTAALGSRGFHWAPKGKERDIPYS